MARLKPYLLCLSLITTTALVGVQFPNALPSLAQSQRRVSNQAMADTYVRRSNQRFNSRDYKGAVADLTQAIRFTPNAASLYVQRGMTLIILKDYQNALKDLDQSVRLDPGNASYYYGRGVVRETVRDNGGAMSDYEQALRLRPGYTEAADRRERLSRKISGKPAPPISASTPAPAPTPPPAPPTLTTRLRQPAAPQPTASMRPPVAPNSVAANNSQVNVYRIANQTTVRIDGQSPGSGVIIARYGNTYYVLTAKHVVASPDEYTIVTASGKKFSVDYKAIKKFGSLDLAVIPFKSNENLSVAQLANSEQVNQGDYIFVSGWPVVSQGLTRNSHQVTDGRITGFQQSDADGYELTYSNPTGGGMSGGPVFNTNGQVIGIHGRAAGNQDVGKIGINLGIPVHLFLRQATQAGLNIQQLGLRTQR